jgi:putative addiction module component (TIGR02574 family)
MSSSFVDTVKTLPLADRLEIIGELWESIAEEGYEPPLTPAQAAEIDRRYEAHRLTPDDVIPWESIKGELTDKYQKR